LSFEFSYRILSGRQRIKYFAKAKTLDDRERHLDLEMLTSRMAHADRERHLQNNIKIKPEQLKLSKTDPST
jgi:hypothetical protein